MERCIGAVSRGVRAPIIRQGDDIVKIVADSVLKASEVHGIEFRDRDVVAVTESVVARAQGNYATIQDIADDIKAKIPGGEFGVVFPILRLCCPPSTSPLMLALCSLRSQFRV